MKHIRLQLILLICSCLVLLPCAPVNVQAQDKAEDGKKVFDNYSTVVGMVYPAGGAMFKATGEMLELFGYFGKSADPVGDAIKRINERLDLLEGRVSGLETRMRAVENEVFRTQNMARVRLLRSKQDALKLLAYKLQQKPTERRDKLALAKEAQIIAAGFLDDPDLWMWSDMREKDGAMLPADFKPLPALEYYVVALVAWVAAIDNATDGDYEFVKREYGRELQKHIAYLSVHAGWKDGDDPESLPENIKVRVSCTLSPITRQSENRKCQIADRCEDKIARVSTVTTQEVIMPLNSDLCNVPPGASARGSEDELERMYGTEVMGKLAEKLVQLKTSGTARDAFVGTFDPSTQTAEYLYGVKPNGDLLWYMHRVVTRKTGPSSGAQGPSDIDRARNPTARVSPGQTTTSGSTSVSRSRVKSTAAKLEVTHILDGPKLVGRGWGDFKQVFSGGGGIVYALRADGSLLWYRHGGYADGGGPETWTGPKAVGSGWQDFKDIFSSGEGKVYALKPDGTLLLYQQIGWQTGERSWQEPRQVGTGWGDFKQVFAGGEGVIYAVTQEGKLLWYKHLGLVLPVAFARARDAREKWEGPVEVGTGWQNFKTIFSPGDGNIYAMKPTGELLWYKHDGYKDGSVRWQAPVQVAADWKDFLFAFSRMTGTYTPPVVR